MRSINLSSDSGNFRGEIDRLFDERHVQIELAFLGCRICSSVLSDAVGVGAVHSLHSDERRPANDQVELLVLPRIHRQEIPHLQDLIAEAGSQQGRAAIDARGQRCQEKR